MKFLNNRFVIATTALLLTGGLLTAGIVTAQNRSAEPITPVVTEIQKLPSAPVPAVSQAEPSPNRPPAPDKRPLTYHNLGSHLDQVVEDHENDTRSQGQSEGRGNAEPASTASDPIPVTIYFTSHRDDITAFLNENGGDLRNVRDGFIEAHVPVSVLGELSEQPGVIRVREIQRPVAK